MKTRVLAGLETGEHTDYLSGRILDCDRGLYFHAIFGRRMTNKTSQTRANKAVIPSVSKREYAELEY
jgi:hypothetical protein